MCVCARARVCGGCLRERLSVSVSVRACMHACVRACVCACVRMCVCACVGVCVDCLCVLDIL